ncbi:hypothetical protein ACGP04_00235 [Piscirickettsia salmonis]|uniref:hypothetical protein n=1 Tax=Piscirickettsia salmonis TaxID=1238 RepID=UPI000F078728|nr:hypothetical protein DA717_14060 [Piscirickettsiaceae bacterium NZ-RLO2]
MHTGIALITMHLINPQLWQVMLKHDQLPGLPVIVHWQCYIFSRKSHIFNIREEADLTGS